MGRKEGAAALSDIGTVIGAVGGAAVTTTFNNENLFGSFCISFAIGFFAYLLIALVVYGKETAGQFIGE